MTKKEKVMDEAFVIAEQQMLGNAVNKNKMQPLLDKQLKIINKLDNQIKWHENKIEGIEADKQRELSKMGDLMDLAMQVTHTLPNGFKVQPDHRRKVEVQDIGAFMRWLKLNRTSQEVFEFFEGAMKLTNLKSFCEKEANAQRANGELSPSVDGVWFGEITYRRLTTCFKKEKK